MMHFFSVSKLGQYFISENVMSEINVVSEITQGYSTKIVLFCFSLKSEMQLLSKSVIKFVKLLLL